MANRIATIEIGFEMATGGAIAELGKLGGAADKTAATVMKELDRIDRAVQTVASTDAAVTRLAAIGKAASTSGATAVREYNRIERAGESMVAQLDRQIAAYGKTASEMRGMKAEALAVAAAQQTQAELAARIRAREAAMYDLEYAAARKVTNAEREAAEEKEMASQRAVEAAAREAVALRDAGIAYQQFEARARAGAASMREADAAAERDAVALGHIKAMLDPAAAAQDRMNREIEEARRVMIAAGMGAEEMARAEALIVTGGGRVVTSAGAQRAGFQQLSMNLGDVATSYAGGMRAGQIFAQQSGQVVQALALIKGGSAGVLGVLAGPWGIALTAAITLGLAFAGSLGQAASEAEKEAEALKTVKGATDALDEATGRLHKSKQQQIDDSARATKQLLTEALAQRTLLQAQADNIARQANDPLVQAANGGIGAAGAINAGWISSNAAEIKRLQDSLGGVGFAAAVDRATAATNKAAKATQEYEAYLARVDAAWSRSGKTAKDQALAQKLIEDALRRRDAATKTAAAGSTALLDAESRIATAANEVQRAEGNLAKVRAENARDLANHSITTAQATARLNEARTALNGARDAQKTHSDAVRAGAKEDREAAAAAKLLADAIASIPYEHAVEFRQIMEAYSKPLVSNNSYADIMANTAKGAAALGDVLENHGPLEALDKQMKALSDSEEAVKRYADAFGGAFGDIGASIAKVGDALVDYGARRRAIHDDLVKGDKTTKEAAQASAKNQVDAYADITGAAKGMFSEHSRIYKGLQAAETTFRAVQLALSIQKMIQDTAETVGSVANSAARATAAGAEGVASQSKLPFPANIAAMAATAAALVGIGVALSGGIGGSHNTLPAANTGTGTVLGDSAAKSESIVHGLDLLKDIDDATLNVSRDMLNSLRAIENSIGGVASLITRTGNLDASAGVDVGVQSTTVSGVVKATVPVVGALLGGIIDKLFGSKTSIIGSGLYGGSQSIGDILGGGFDLQTYSDIEKKKKLFGVTTSTKYSTAYGQADDGISDQFGLLIRQFYETIGKAAGPLGQSLDDVQGKLSGFVVNIGKIDLAGLSGTEIEEKLSAIFGAAADDMAAAAVPGLDRFQKVGEGAFETLVRVSSTVEQIDATFRRLGATSTTMGVDVDMAIAGLFDSVGDFTSAADAYFDKYYSDAEKAAAMTAQLGGVFDHLGLAMPDTLASFRALVEAQDLTTTAGQQTYATLLQIAPAFADLKGALEGTASAAEILRQREDLEKQLLEAQGDTAAIRALELSKIDESNRAIQERIWAIQDEKEAEAKAAQQAQEVAAKLQAIASERLSLEGQLLQLQGNVPELRRRELEALDPTNRAIKQLIYDLTDQKAATDAAAQAAAVDAAAQKAIADERAGLERQLLDLAGDTVAIRALELAKLDPTNRELQKLIWARQDEATALAETTRQQEELAAKLKAIADERIGLEDQLLQLQGNTAELRRRELEKLGPTNRAIQQLIYDLTDQKEATDAAAKAAADAAAAQKVIADERAGLERQLLELNADTVAIRALDLAKLDESNRALQLLIWTRQDEAEVAAAAAKVIADAAAKEQAVADERAGLERQLLDLSGDTNAIRALDLLKLDESNRALQTLIWTRQDETAAAQAAAAAQKAIADERAGLQQQLYQALGDTDALRAIELEKLDASNRAIQLQIWALADQAAATEKAAQAAQEAAAKEQAVAQERAGLQQQIWQLLGDTASLRAAELARLDPSNRAMQERIYAITDQQAADEAAAKAAQVAQQAADDAAKAADQLRQAWAAIGDGLMDEVRRIRGLSATGPQSYAALLGQFNDATSYARAGDQDAAKSLTGLSKQLLDAAALVATSQQELGRVQGMTAASLEDTLAVISAGAFSAKDNLTTAQNWASASVANAPASGGTADLVAEVRSLREEVAALRADQRDANATIAANTGRTARILDNVTSESGGDAVTTQAAAA